VDSKIGWIDRQQRQGAPYRRCVFGNEVDYTVNWNAPEGDTSNNGFIFAPGATDPGYPNTCVRHLSGPWWAEMNEGDPARPCAFSFELEEGP
jgi:hypothetical protein